MKTSGSALILLLAVLFLASCKKDDPEPNDNTPTTPASSVFTFFKTGASWTYDTYDSEGAPVIQQTYTINSISSNYATVNWNVAGMFNYTVNWYADNNAFSMLCSPGDGKKLIWCDATPSIGEFWFEGWTDSTGTVTDTCRIVGVGETVTVPAGTFTNCVKIRETTSDDPMCYKLFWLSFTAGVVKTEGTTTEDYPTIIYEDLSSQQ